jgi:hypothetical protein
VINTVLYYKYRSILVNTNVLTHNIKTKPENRERKNCLINQESLLKAHSNLPCLIRSRRINNIRFRSYVVTAFRN